LNLYLVRHGAALPASVDPERPLSKEGRACVGALADYLSRSIAPPAFIATSSKARARETAEILAARLNPPEGIINMSGLLPDDSPDIIAALPGECKKDLMVVSHLPLLDVALVFLTGAQATAGSGFNTGTCIHLKAANNGWSIKRRVHCADL